MRRRVGAGPELAIFSVLALACGTDIDGEPAPICTDGTGCPVGSVCVDGVRCALLPDAEMPRSDLEFTLLAGGPPRLRPGPSPGPQGDAGSLDDGGARRDGGRTDPFDRCLGGLRLCAGQCVDVRSDASNCGGCGIECPAAQACDFGVCCGGGRTTCDGRCVDLLADPGNCGVCGLECPGPARCVLGGCEPL